MIYSFFAKVFLHEFLYINEQINLLANILPVSVTVVIGLLSVSHVGVVITFVVNGVINVTGFTAEKEKQSLKK